MTVVIGAVGIVYAALTAALFRFGKPWANPMFLVLLYYFFNYPVRAFLLSEYPESYNGTYFFTDAEILVALTYSSCYVIIFVGAYLLLLNHFRVRLDFAGLRQSPVDVNLFFFTALLVLLSGAMSIGYELSAGGSFSLGADIEALRRPFWVNVASLPYSLKWVCICMGIFLWFKNRDFSSTVLTVLLCTLVLLEAVLSTGKGVVAS